MRRLENWRLGPVTDRSVTLIVEDRHQLRISVLAPDLFRVSLLRDGAWRLDRSWCVNPDGLTPEAGLARDSHAGFAPCPFVVDETDGLQLRTDRLAVRIEAPLRLVWSARLGGKWVEIAADRATGAYEIGRRDGRLAHFMDIDRDEPVLGLGEKAGPLNRARRRFEMRNLDALGYDARHTDPLYKHVPFAITATQAAGYWSIFYDNLSPCWFDLGNEHDNYHAPYRAWRAEDGDIDYYFAWSPDLADLPARQAWLTGGTAFPPRWSLGYSGSTMAYTDAPDAQDQLLSFLDLLTRHDIPCDSFHLSSGYTSIDGKRYVFNWNRDKVPDPAALGRAFAAAGIELVANIKPCLLHDHPRYGEAAAAGLFVTDSESGAPERSMFWDDQGSHLDFTNPATRRWWQDGVTDALLRNGIHSTWNDNNEYEIWDRAAQCAGDGKPVEINLIRPVHALLMNRASEAAQRAHAPGKRPYLVSRSGAPGLQRHAQTWTGDNRTSWETLRWNIPMGLGLGLSGFFNIGHDVGGFAGPRPEPELFLRWVQNGIFSPRFTIHSWNDDGTVNEPWMYPEILPQVRDAIALRYRLIPFLYTLLWRAVTEGRPILRPTFLEFPQDTRCWDETFDFMVGSDLLVANVLEPGATHRTVYLPQNATGWWDWSAQSWHAGGQVLKVPVDLSSIPMFVQAGAILPLGRGARRARVQAEAGRDLALFPLQDKGSGGGMMFEDDGETENGPFCLTRLSLEWDGRDNRLGWSIEGAAAPTFPKARLNICGGGHVLTPQGRMDDGDEIDLNVGQ